MIPEEKWFYFSNGGKASSIEELERVLESMSEAEFRHHVNHDRNDFANWIENIFGEVKLALSMREVSERDGLLIILDDFLKRKHKKKPAGKTPRLIIPKGRKLSSDLTSELTLQPSLEPSPEPSSKPSSKQEKELSEKEIKDVVDDARQVFEKEKMLEIEREERHHPAYNRFILKEFVYGFLLGLIFGLIMLGVIFNLRF